MKNFIKRIFSRQLSITKDPENLVSYSIGKYKNTYQWLEDYDQGTKETAKILANARIVQDTLRAIQTRA